MFTKIIDRFMGQKSVIKNYDSIISHSSFMGMSQIAGDFFRNDINMFIGFLVASGKADLAAFYYQSYYRICSPLSTAVDLIVSNAVTIPFKVYDKKQNKFISFHDVLSLLESPNMQQNETSESFLRKVFSDYNLTGNAFILAMRTNINAAPVMLKAINPKLVTITNVDSVKNQYTIINEEQDYIFNEIRIKGKIKYISNNFKLGVGELLHLKKHNSLYDDMNIVGMSPINPILPEITQYLISSIHNLSMLEKGGRLTGVMVSDGFLSKKQIEEIREQKRMYEGAASAGTLGIFTNGLKYQSLGQSNRDMDFATLKDDVTKGIFRQYHIPIALISEESMTMSNLENAALLLYDQAVLPFLKEILPPISNFLMQDYPNSSNYKITYNDKDIPALEMRRLNIIQKMNQTESFTINEQRDVAAYIKEDGGETIFRQSNQIPVAGKDWENTLEKISSKNTSSKPVTNNDTVADASTQEAQKEKIQVALKNKKTKDHNKAFTNNEIEKIIEEVMIL